MKLLVTGSNGQLGWELVRSLAPLGEVIALGRDRLDLAQLETIGPAIRALRPDVIVNAAAYTAVDRAEKEEDLARRVNGEAVGLLADKAASCGALLIHFSTDYVFDGQKTAAYSESDIVAPLNAYGRSKLQGEEAIRRSACDWLIFRTTWVYGVRGNNFLQTILRLAREREMLKIVGDQHGAPTTARFLADSTAHVVRISQSARRNHDFSSDLYNLTAAGSTTWHGFATTIVDAARPAAGDGRAIKVKTIDAIASADYPTPAARPQNSVLDNSRFIARFDLYRPDWKEGLRNTMQDLLQG